MPIPVPLQGAHKHHLCDVSATSKNKEVCVGMASMLYQVQVARKASVTDRFW